MAPTAPRRPLSAQIRQPIRPGPGRGDPAGPRPLPGRSADPPPVHRTIICVALPCMAILPEDGQLDGHGIAGVYHSGRRLLSRSQLRISGCEPTLVQGRSVSPDRATFVAVVRTSADGVPDPDVCVERVRDALGTERITLRSFAAQPLKLPVEVALGTDLAELGAVTAGRSGPELAASVHESGLRWSTDDGGHAVVTADPSPHDALASAGLLRWELVLRPGTTQTIELRVTSDRTERDRPLSRAGCASDRFLPEAQAAGDDHRLPALLGTALGDLRALLIRDPAHPADIFPGAGAPWRCGSAPAEALWAVRMALPLSTRLAATTLRMLARTQLLVQGPDFGRIPGPLRDAGPHLPPSCTGMEATLAFPAVLAEAWRWGMPEQEFTELVPAAERCLQWLRQAAGDEGLLPEPGAAGVLRSDTQAHAHRAAILGADVLEATGRPGAEDWRQWAGALRDRFQEDFWIDDRAGGRPAAARLPGGRPLSLLGSSAAHLLDTGLVGGGRPAAGLLDKERTEQLARLLGGPALDSGWGLRSLGTGEPGHNPFGHRSGAVRVHETAVAVAGLAAAGHEKEASSLVRGLVDASEAFGNRLPEMYAGRQRTADGVPAPHPAACRPAAVAAACALHLLTALAGIRPDAPARMVALRPIRCVPLGAVQISGLRVAGEPFAVRISRRGLAMVEQAAEGLQLGA
ncbi:glycogen debranching N-terminal domain-containing protein [Streptomyces sp. NBC_00390]|uniref:glycogen debranching N-terminal domain-containing protein n=1 Tax=Streptomyces sp. NBC_00390 TaxID=2975736 RepID=UPI003FCD8BB4